MVKETINFNTSLGAADFLERTVERLESENAMLLRVVNGYREREELAWGLLGEFDKYTSSVWLRADTVSEKLRAVLEGRTPEVKD